MPKMPAALMNRIALGLFVSAVGGFVAFHFIPFWSLPNLDSYSNVTGWEAWTEFARSLRSFSSAEFGDLILWSSFLTGSLLLVASPWLITVFRMSRMAWWICVLATAISTLGFFGVLIPNMVTSEEVGPGPGLLCLFSAMLLNFLGFCFIRREIPVDPVTEPA
jgi:hypothetical protein